jgi:TPR repeat protein
MVAAEFFERAAHFENLDGVNSFGVCLEKGEWIEADIDRSVSC